MSSPPRAKAAVEKSLSVKELYHIRRGKHLLSCTQEPFFSPERALNAISYTYVRTRMMKQKKRMNMVMVNNVCCSLVEN